MASERGSRRAFVGVSALLFAAGAAVTVARCTSMSAMAVVGAAITVERVAPAGERVAKAIGVLVVGAGSFLTARAAGLV